MREGKRGKADLITAAQETRFPREKLCEAMADDFTRFLGDLKSRTNIVRIIGKYVPLDRKGRNYWGRCPFHHEKTPSFAVNEEEQFYHCFGCSASGDVIKFVREMESVEFMDAVRLLAEDAGMKLPEFSGRNSEDIERKKKLKDRLHRLMKDAANFYYLALRSEAGASVREYLSARGITEEASKKFTLGYSPDFTQSIAYLTEKGYTAEEMKTAGVAGEKNGRVYDLLAERLIFPIVSAMNDVVAFGGRVMVKTDFAKYRNTQETPLFQKSRTLYALNVLKELKQQRGISSCIMVEGYMDTIALWQSGFQNVVASMGTSLTKDQARMIKRFTDRVYICYDGDSAGQNATLRGLDILGSEGITVKVVSVPDGLDPDDLVRERGQDAFQKCLDDALPLVDFKLLTLRNKYDIRGSEGRRKYVLEALAVVAEIKSSTEQEDCLKLLRTETGFTLESLQRDLAAVSAKEQPVLVTPAADRQDADPGFAAARVMLYCLTKGHAPISDISMVLPQLRSEAHKRMAGYLEMCQKEGTAPVPSVLYDFVEESDFAEVGRVLSVAETFSDEAQLKKYYADAMRRLREAELTEKISLLGSRAAAEDGIEERRKLTGMLRELMDELTALKRQ